MNTDIPLEVTPARGFLIIGDLHLTSSRPSRRRKGYAEAILKKLEQCLQIAAREKLIPVFLGDIYHFPVEPEETLKAQLTELLATSWTVPLCNVGNHDKAGLHLQRCDSLWTLHASRLLRVCMTAGPFALIEIEDGGNRAVIGIGMTPHGQIIPTDTNDADGDDIFGGRADGIIWFTHHDLAFKGAYLKSSPLQEIKGCGIAVNGHMHHRRQFEEKGATTWCNFGSLARTASDEASHSPVAMAFLPLHEDLFQAWPIQHDTDAFDFAASLAPSMPRSAKEHTEDFAQMLVDELSAAAAQTPSGTVLKDELVAFLDEGRRPLARQPILNLLARAVENGN